MQLAPVSVDANRIGASLGCAPEAGRLHRHQEGRQNNLLYGCPDYAIGEDSNRDGYEELVVQCPTSDAAAALNPGGRQDHGPLSLLVRHLLEHPAETSPGTDHQLIEHAQPAVGVCAGGSGPPEDRPVSSQTGMVRRWLHHLQHRHARLSRLAQVGWHRQPHIR